MPLAHALPVPQGCSLVSQSSCREPAVCADPPERELGFLLGASALWLLRPLAVPTPCAANGQKPPDHSANRHGLELPLCAPHWRGPGQIGPGANSMLPELPVQWG